MKYIYTDYQQKTKFECEVEDILAADKLYEAAGNRMNVSKKGKKEMPNDVTTWSPDWQKGTENARV